MTSSGDGDRPRFGVGKFGRPLWSSRDRDAERVRGTLRSAGFRDYGVRHLDGFAVEGTSAGDGEPLYVAFCGDSGQAAVRLAAYRVVLQRRGFGVEPDLQDAQSLIVRVPDRLRPDWGAVALRVAVVLAIVASVLVAVSFGSGTRGLVGGVGGAVAGVVAVWLAGYWYRGRTALR
ncbi:hypothetical protein AB0M47_20930 [Hamadaea sp. NPDC051192]|uniref:hypothetical protein n=1 Tax=Hamadaea sp. NPDC051192 TaxID=3154940 RepID=UPI0034347ED7